MDKSEEKRVEEKASIRNRQGHISCAQRAAQV